MSHYNFTNFNENKWLRCWGRLAQWESVCFVIQWAIQVQFSAQSRFLTNWWEVFCACGNQNAQTQFLENILFSISGNWPIVPSTVSNTCWAKGNVARTNWSYDAHELSWDGCMQSSYSTTQLYTNNSATSRQLWPPHRKRVYGKCPSGKIKKRTTMWLRPPSQRGKVESRMGW